MVRNNQRLELLLKVAKLILITRHSNAGIERVFSLVNKIMPVGTGIDWIEGLLSSIFTVKMELLESQENCYCFKLSKRLLKSAKKQHIPLASQKDNTNYHKDISDECHF